MIRSQLALPLAAALLLGACQSDSSPIPASEETAATVTSAVGDTAVPGDTRSTEPYDGIREDEVLRFTGTEPFWGGQVSGKTLTYTTPEDQDGTEIAVERFAGRGGLSFGRTLEGGKFEMVVTPLECSDGMSDRTYPFTVTLEIGEETRNGCGWTEAKPFQGREQP
jgi:uncharacterized membrane protein